MADIDITVSLASRMGISQHVRCVCVAKETHRDLIHEWGHTNDGTVCYIIVSFIQYNSRSVRTQLLLYTELLSSYIIIIIIIFINCSWVVTQWQWLFYMHTKHEIGYY